MKLIQITDIHLAPPGLLISGRDPLANFDAALDDIALRHPDAELIVITGDLSHSGCHEGYLQLRRRLSRIRVPVALMIGNHDDRDLFMQVFPERQGEAGFVQGMRELSEGRALFLDTHDTEGHDGLLCERRLNWFEAQLAAGPGPFWVFLHHNPIPTHLGPIDRIMLRNPQDFAAVVARHRDRIAHIFHGHTHLPMSGALHGVPVSCPRGTAQAGFPNYGEDRLLPHSDLPASYAVIISEGPITTVMMVEFGLHMEQIPNSRVVASL